MSTKHTALSTKQKIFARRSSALCLVLSAYCLVLPLAGCIHRSLTIKTDPPGAMVYVNDQLKGDSPVTYDFEWYGWYRLTLRKDGYERLDDRKLVRAPVWFWIPFDLPMELLPFPIRDDRTWSYTLTPTTELPTPLPPAITNPKTEQSPAPAVEREPPGPALAPAAPSAPATPMSEETPDDSR